MYNNLLCIDYEYSNEKTDAPVPLLCYNRGGLIVPKLCLLPYIRLVIDKAMQYATSEGIISMVVISQIRMNIIMVQMYYGAIE